MGKNGKGVNKSPGLSKACHFCQRQKVTEKKDCKHQQEWLKKNKQAAEADIAISSVDTEILMTSYVEDNTS